MTPVAVLRPGVLKCRIFCELRAPRFLTCFVTDGCIYCCCGILTRSKSDASYCTRDDAVDLVERGIVPYYFEATPTSTVPICKILAAGMLASPFRVFGLC